MSPHRQRRREMTATLRRALLHPGKGQWSAALVLAAFGLIAVTALQVAENDDDYSGMRQSDLIQSLSGLQAATQRAEADIDELTRVRNSLLDETEATSTALDQSRAELEALGILAGTLPAKGPGIRVTATVPDSLLAVNHLLDAIEELRDAGAEAIEINDRVRVVAQTWVDAAAEGIEIDGVVLTSPFTIDAIGDPGSLASALEFVGGFVDDVTLDNGEVTISELELVEVSATRAAPDPSFAETVPSD